MYIMYIIHNMYFVLITYLVVITRECKAGYIVLDNIHIICASVDGVSTKDDSLCYNTPTIITITCSL